MKKASIFGMLCFLILFSASVHAWSVSPNLIEDTFLPGESKTYTLIFSNTENSSVTLNIAKSGTISTWMSVSPYSFTLNAGTPTDPTQRVVTVTISVPTNADGDYSGQLVIDDGSSVNNLNVVVHVSKWVFSQNITVDAFTKVVLTNPAFSFEVQDIGAEVVIYVGGTKYNLYPNQNYEAQDVKITVIDRWDSQAKLLIQTTDANTQITTEPLNIQQSEGSLEPLVSKWSFKVQEGTTKKMYVSVMNNYPYDCELKDLIMVGDVIETTEGKKPLDFGEVSLGKLGPGEEFVYPVEVNTYDVDYGTYTIRTQLIALCNGQREVAETVWELTVVSSVKPQVKSESELTIDYPETATVGQEITISVTNIPAGWNVYLIEQPSMNKTSVDRADDYFKWTGKFEKEGTYTIPIWIFKDDGSVQIKNIQISVAKTTQTQQTSSKLVIDIVPSPPKPDDEITITVKDAKTLQPVDANIQIEVYEGNRKLNVFTYSTPFVVESNKKYCIIAVAEGYTKENVCIDVKAIPTRLIVPAKVFVGDEITIKYLDASNKPVPNGKIIVNGKEYDNSVINLTIENREYTIEAMADGYESKKVTLKPQVKLSEVSSVKPDYTGEPLNLTFNMDVSWKIMYGDEEVESGQGKVIHFIPQKAGVYDIYVNGQYYDSFAVEKKSFNYTNILIVVVIGAVLYYFSQRKPKGRTRAGYISEIPRGSVEVE